MKKIKLFLVIVALLVTSLITNNTFSQWTYCTGSPSIVNFGSYPSIFVLDPQTVFVSGCTTTPGSAGFPAVYRTTNGGTSFTSIPTTGMTLDLMCIWATDINTIYVGDGGGAGGAGGNAHVWKTTNGGTTWTNILSTGGGVGFINGIVFSRTSPQVGVCESDPPTAGTNYWWQLTTNNGASWTAFSGPNAGSLYASAQNGVMCVDAMYWGVGASYGQTSGGTCRLVYTTNGGTSFNNPTIGGLTLGGGDFMDAYAMRDDKLHGVTFNAVSLPNIAVTSNGGTSWSVVNVGGPFTAAGFGCAKWVPQSDWVYIMGDAQTNSSGCCKKSTDDGATWTFLTTVGLSGWASMDLVVSGGNVYAYAISSADGSVIKLVQPAPVGINNNGQNVPKDYVLGQNYPNPFNPSTNIEYSLPKASQVTLTVYDMLGNSVMTVLNEYQNAGNHTAIVDASKLASGIYLYTLKAGDFQQTKKMSLVK